VSTGTAVDVVMPQMGVSVSEGTITRWRKQVGDRVEADETIVEISTDKVDTEVPSPGSGIVSEILVAEGETVDVGTRIAVITSGDASTAEAPAPPQAAPPAPEPAEPAPAPEPAPVSEDAPPPAAPTPPVAEAATDDDSDSNGDGEARSFMSPVVARMVSEHGLDIAQIPGTGRGGRVTKKDVEQFLEERDGTAPAAPPVAAPAAVVAPPVAAVPAPAPPPPAAPAPAAAPTAASGTSSWGVEETSQLGTVRKMIARNMRASIETAAHVTSVSEVDMTRVVNLRKELNSHYQRDHGVKVSFMPFIMRAVIEAIPLWPWVNAEVRGDSVVVKKYVNLGVAVAIDDAKGLVVPVIHNAEEKNLLGLTRSLIDVADRARKKQLTVDEMSGGSFTITNPGVFGALFGTPIIPPPQVAIIDVEAIVKRPVVVTDEFGNDSIAIRSMMYLPISYDHRLIDGAYAAQFMQQVKKNLETFGAAEYGA
jgi:pyruvate dehydrogenase E2 component (dihydrolipoamide acetyltransferase)